MISESQTFDRIVVMIKQLSPHYRLKLMEVLMQTLWEILPSKPESMSEPAIQTQSLLDLRGSIPVSGPQDFKAIRQQVIAAQTQQVIQNE